MLQTYNWRYIATLTLITLQLPVLATPDRPVPVTTLPLEKIAIYPVQDVPANVMSLNTSTLSSEITGRIQAIPVRVGHETQQGEVLAEIDCADYHDARSQMQANYQRTESELNHTQWQVTRTKALAESHNASAERLHRLEATAVSLQAQLNADTAKIQQANYNIKRCQLLAPFHGVVTERLANVGEFARPGTQIIRLIDTENLEVEADLHVSEVSDFEAAQKLEFVVQGRAYPVLLRTTLPIQDPNSRTQRVRLLFTAERPLAGTAGRLTWRTEYPALPTEYVRQYQGNLGVFVAHNNRAKFIPLPAAIEGQPVVVEQPIRYPIIDQGRFAITEASLISIQQHE